MLLFAPCGRCAAIMLLLAPYAGRSAAINTTSTKVAISCNYRENVFYFNWKKWHFKNSKHWSTFFTCVLCAFSALHDPFLPQEQRIKVLMFCYWYLLFIRIRNWNNSIWGPGRICGAQRRKFVKNQIKPEWRTSFEVWN